MFYLYGVIDQSDVELELPRGLEDGELNIHSINGIGVVTGRLSDLPNRDTENAHRHMEVLTTLMGQCTVVPSRFGAIFHSHDELERFIINLHDSLSANLQRLRGKVEMGLKASNPQANILKSIRDEARQTETAKYAASSTSLRFFPTLPQTKEHMKRHADVNEGLAYTVCKPFTNLVTEYIWRPTSTGVGRASIAASFLLPREQVEAFQNTLDALRHAEPALNIQSTGPWPPYSFINSPQKAAEGDAPTNETGVSEETAAENTEPQHPVS